MEAPATSCSGGSLPAALFPRHLPAPVTVHACTAAKATSSCASVRSRVALALLQRAAQQGVRFSVIVTEGRPDDTGLSMARALDELHIPVTLVLDSGAAYCLERCAHGRMACRRGTPH